MCLLILKPKDKEIPEAHIRESWKRNSHGAGYARVLESGEIEIRKGFFNVDQFVKWVKSETKDLTAMIHMRFATTGGKVKDNCHPHWAGGGFAVGHNGVLDAECIEDESDTVAFIRDYIFPVMEKNPKSIFQNQKWLKILEESTDGSKLVFLGPEGQYKIIHEEAGHWDHGIWYSNWMYLPFVDRPKTEEVKEVTGATQTEKTGPTKDATTNSDHHSTSKHETPRLYQGYEDYVLDEKSGVWVKKNDVSTPMKGDRFLEFHACAECENCNGKLTIANGGYYDRISDIYLCAECKEHVENADNLLKQVEDNFNKERERKAKANV